MAIPTALLRRFYVDNSLINTNTGFEFQLANKIAPTTIISLGPLEMDGTIFAPDQIRVSSSKVRPASAVNELAPFYLRMEKRMTISVPNAQLQPGEHSIILHLMTKEVGAVSIEFTETIP